MNSEQVSERIRAALKNRSLTVESPPSDVGKQLCTWMRAQLGYHTEATEAQPGNEQPAEVLAPTPTPPANAGDGASGSGVLGGATDMNAVLRRAAGYYY